MLPVCPYCGNPLYAKIVEQPNGQALFQVDHRCPNGVIVRSKLYEEAETAIEAVRISFPTNFEWSLTKDNPPTKEDADDWGYVFVGNPYFVAKVEKVLTNPEEFPKWTRIDQTENERMAHKSKPALSVSAPETYCLFSPATLKYS